MSEDEVEKRITDRLSAMYFHAMSTQNLDTDTVDPADSLERALGYHLKPVMQLIKEAHSDTCNKDDIISKS